MNKTYQDPDAASEYGKYSNSKDGQMQRELMKNAFQNFLPPDPDLSILDAGCGAGWLVRELSKKYKTVQGIDLSPDLIDRARKNYPGLKFQIADLSLPLPLEKQSLDAIIVNMVMHNIQDQAQAFKNLAGALKTGGKILMTSVNPYYGYPVGAWKRSWWGKLFRLKPYLKLRPYNRPADESRSFIWNKTIPARFSPLPEQINNALSAGLTLEHIEDIKATSDSQKFDFQYRLFRFPLITLMIFKK
jgi:SAM-dependent methyltransferase